MHFKDNQGGVSLRPSLVLCHVIMHTLLAVDSDGVFGQSLLGIHDLDYFTIRHGGKTKI